MQTKKRTSFVSKQHSKSGPASVSSLLSSIIKSENISEKAKSVDFFKNWPEIVGEELSRNSKPLKLDRGTLTIETLDATYIQELSLIQNEIKKKISALGFSGLVANLKFISSNPKKFNLKP